MFSVLAAFWLRQQQQQLSYVGAGQTVGRVHTGATSTSVSTASPGCPVVAQLERKRHHPRGDGRMTGPGRLASNHALSRTLRHRLSAVANTAHRLASEVSTAVRINQRRGARVSRNKQLFPSFPHATILSVCCTTKQSFTVLCPALFFSRFCVLTHTRSMAAAHDTRTDDWASPKHFHIYIRFDPEGSVTRVDSKKEPRSGNDTPAPSSRLTENAKDERGSVIQQKMTKLASIATRSASAQTMNPVTDGSSLLHWRTSWWVGVFDHPRVSVRQLVFKIKNRADSHCVCVSSFFCVPVGVRVCDTS